MSRHRIAIAVNEDGKTIPRGMLGHAHYFLIVDLDATKGKELARSLRLNPYKTTLQRGKTYDVADVLSDCQTIICRHIGKRGIPRMKARGFELIFTRCATVDDALAEFRRKSGVAHEIPPSAPVAVLDHSKCHPEKCDKGICAAVEACPVKAIKQEAPYELPEIVQHMCEGYEYCVEACPLKAIRMMEM